MTLPLIDDLHYYDPAVGHGLAHDPFNALVAPRPIGWMSSCDKEGRLNLAPYSFFNALNYTPPIIGFSSQRWKDTVSNIEATGEFVWNLATRPLAAAMNKSSLTVPHGVSEFELAGLTPLPCRQVKVPRVGESPVAMECRLLDIIRLKGLDGKPAEGWLVLGQVVGVHIHRALIRNGVYQTAEAHPILRAGGLGAYAEVTPETMFDLPRVTATSWKS